MIEQIRLAIESLAQEYWGDSPERAVLRRVIEEIL